MDKVVVNSLWIGPSLTRLERASIQSYIDTGHEFHLHTYEDVKNVPVDCIIKDANLIMEEKEIFEIKDTCISFSDIWRFKMLYELGGYWVDLDMIALKKLDFKEDFVMASERTIQRGAYKNKLPFVSQVAVLKAPPHSHFYLSLYEKCVKHCKRYVNNQDTLKYMKIFRQHIIAHGLEGCVKGPEVFCNLDWWHTKEIFYNQPYKTKYGVEPNDNLLGGYSIHFWRQITRKYKMDLNASYHEDSLYEKLLRRHNC